MTAANDPSSSGSSPPPADAAADTPSAPAAEPALPPIAAGAEEGARIPLPPPATPPPEPTSPEQFTAEIARLDRTLTAIALALAFLLASFAIRNSDFWMHLASGRLLAHGEYHFGVDPF